MEETRSKRLVDSNREKSRKKNVQEKKKKSDSAAFSSCSSVNDLSMENFMVVGKGCNYAKSRRNEFRLHECYSETSLTPYVEYGRHLKDVTQGERLYTIPSNSSFTSAKSDFSDAYQKQIHDLEEGFFKENLVLQCMKKQLSSKELIGFKSVSTETDDISPEGEFKAKLKELEKKISTKEKKIKDLSRKLEEYSKAKEIQIQENRGLSHTVNLLQRQLHSMFELLGKKNWNSDDQEEFSKNQVKTAELESLVASYKEEKKHLSEALEILTFKLEAKEKEVSVKARELVEYKNKSTLEMCKLINQVDNLQKEAKNQSEILDTKISEAQISMEEEIVNITLKLEEQYQKDVKSAIEKFHADFVRLSDLPRTAIEQLLKFCEPSKIDFISYQKEWDKQQSALEAKIESLQLDHNKNVLQLKDAYESKIMFLKAQVEALSTQLKERKEIIDVFENELMIYKSTSSMNLLKASTLGDDISNLKELYTAEISSQKQIHNLQLHVFDQKVKTLTEEILYLAKNEEIRLHELQYSRKMALAFREKYEQLVSDWEEKLEKDFFEASCPEVVGAQEFDIIIGEFMDLIQLLKRTEEAHEEKIKLLEVQNANEKMILLQDVEEFKVKLENLIEFQNIQKSLDATIYDLVKSVEKNCTETMETLLRSHVTEMSYRQMEISASEKRHIEEIDELKNDHEKELEDLRQRVELLKSTKPMLDNELTVISEEVVSTETTSHEEVEALRRERNEITARFMKAEGIIAIKEETEKALSDRITELENVLRLKEENCRKELENLMADYLKEKVISAAKDDLAKELEDKLKVQEALLEKSCREVDRLAKIVSSLAVKAETVFHSNGGDFNPSPEVGDVGQEVKEMSERLKVKLMETFEDLEVFKSKDEDTETTKIDLKRAVEKNSILEEEKNLIMKENNEIKKEISSLVESISEKEKVLAELKPQLEELSKLPGLKSKVEILETEKEEILRREDLANKEKEEILEKNVSLEATVKELNKRIDELKTEAGNRKEREEEEVFSINLQEVRFLYEEEIEETIAVSAVACQTQLECHDIPELGKTKPESTASSHEEVVKNMQEEVSIAVRERNELREFLEDLQKQKNSLKEELEHLREENLLFRTKYGAVVLAVPERDSETGMSEMNREIRKLSSCVKTLSEKLDMMKVSNDLLLSESQEHFKHNQNLVSELEEAWSQRYEIEDQLAKVRRENTLLNLHRKQLEESNKRISSLVNEGKPSVVSWIKIHETVENIVDEVLALKSTINDSDSEAGPSTEPEFSRTNAELKVVASSLHAQLKNKTLLCDELIVQKETLERELKNLERLLEKNDSRLMGGCYEAPHELCNPGNGHLELQYRQPSACSLEKRHILDCDGNMHSTEEVEIWEEEVMNSNNLTVYLEHQVELEEAQFCNRDHELKMQKQENPTEENVPLDDDGECLKTIELVYEKEVVELTKEFEREVEKLKEEFGSEREDDDQQENYAKEIERLKIYFQKKWKDLEKRYVEIYSRKKRVGFISTPELNDILVQFLAILREEESEEKKKKRVESFLTDVLNRRDEEVNTLRQHYQEAVAMLKSKHDSEVRQLQAAVLQLKESITTALSKGGEEGKENLLENIRAEYEAKLEEEKKRLYDLLEDARQKHEKEVADLEEFWTEKLSECETRCALVKATGRRPKGQQQPTGESKQSDPDKTKIEQSLSERGASPALEKQTANYRGAIQNVGIEEADPQDSLCVSCLANQSLLERMDLKTDDDKLDVIQQRDTLEEMILSMRNIVTKLLTFIGQHKPDLNASLGVDETLYKSLHLDLDRTLSDEGLPSSGALMALELSTIFQEIRDNTLLNSSSQVRFELDRCLKQLNKDATSLLALSCPENSIKNLRELVKRVEREKNELEKKLLRVEEEQKEMKKEMVTTKERLSQWERNLEVVTEGYGEEIVEPKEIVSLSNFKEKLKLFQSESCAQAPQDLNLMEEICKEGDRLQEEWLKEKCDLQQQIDSADKQLHSLKKFLEEQALEREQEREAFDREINSLQENLKAKERDSTLQNRTNREVGLLPVMSLADLTVEALASQVKDLTARLTETEKNKTAVEGEFQNAVKKIWSLREVIQELEVQLAEVSERENNLKKKVEKMEGLIEEHSRASRTFKEELEACKSQNELKYSEHVKCLEEEVMGLRHVADQVNPETLSQLKTSLRQIEAALIKKTKDLEQLHESSANVSCSSPSEDVSIRDHLDVTRCSTPDEMCSNGQLLSAILPMEEIDRLNEKLARHTRAEEVAMKYIQDLKMQTRNHRKALEEVQTERDVLLDKVDGYLKENSGLKARLEEQRCNAGLLQKQLNANLESQISRLEVDVEKLNEMCHDKDKQLREMKQILENTKKTLKVKETEAVNKNREVNSLITTLKTDLENALSENEKLEEKLENTMEKLRESMKMPALIESMLDEKNAEIDRLEKEVARLSTERTSSGVSSKSYRGEENPKRRIRFSEPDSFSENISSITVNCPSDLRNCSDSFGDFKNSFKSRRPIGNSTKLESVSSIAPLQLSPRGGDSFNWKASSPIIPKEPVNTTPSKTSLPSPDLQQMEEISKLQETIDSKQREISELHLEIDILKRQLVEVNQEVATAKSRAKEIQNDLSAREEDIRKLENKEKSLLASMESLKAKHAEEVEEFENKLRFERGRVEKIYEEIKILEEKKVEIEKAFLNLKEDYNEKISGEKRTAEALVQRIEMLEARNEESENKAGALEKELENAMRESEKTIQMLTEEIVALKKENEKKQLASGLKENAETQVEDEGCFCQNGLTLDIPQAREGCATPFGEDLDELKAEFEKLAAVLAERDFNKREAFSYAMAVRRLLSVLLGRLDEMSKEVETHMKKVMESSVDELAVKVQRELVLSAKLDNQLLSSIRANGFTSKEATPQPDSLDFADDSRREMGDGDCHVEVPKPVESPQKPSSGWYKEVKQKLDEMMQAKGRLEGKIKDQQKVIKILEENLEKEKERMLEEKERCVEDAKIMELLRVNLEKGLRDLKVRERELKKEKQQRVALEKEIENLRKQEVKERENKKILDLYAQVETQKEKLTSMGKALEEERKKSQEVRLSLEECQIERMSEKNAQKLMESDLALLREQKENYKAELVNARKLLYARNMEIGLLKRKINLQEIDIKALTVATNLNPQFSSDTSSQASNAGGPLDFSFDPAESSASLMTKMKKLNTCVQWHARESAEMGEALMYLGQETEQMRDVIRALEENGEGKLGDETLVSDLEIEKKLWSLERDRLVMDKETLQKENEVLRRNLDVTCRNETFLREENSKLKKAIKLQKTEFPNNFDDMKPCHRYNVENNFLQERVTHLMHKCMRTESHRKALAWQKNYLLINLRDHERCEEEASRRAGMRKKSGRRRGKGRFKIVAIAAIAIFRMRYIMKRWHPNAFFLLFPNSAEQNFESKVSAPGSVLHIYNEPINPLSYQTQNIIRQTSSQVLRSPPTRDPGSQLLPAVTESFDTFKRAQRTSAW